MSYADSLRQQAAWVREALDPATPDTQRITLDDVDVDELEAAAAEIERLREQLASARKALEDISNPLSRMTRLANAEGAKLDGTVALKLASDPNYLKEIARNALTDDQRKPVCEWCDNCKTEPCNGLEEARLCSRFLR